MHTLFERLSPQANTFQLVVDEITVTLQEVVMILGLCVVGPLIVGSIALG